MPHDKLKRERASGVQPNALVVTGVVTSFHHDGVQFGIIGRDIDELRKIHKALGGQEPFRISDCRPAGFMKLDDIVLDDDL